MNPDVKPAPLSEMVHLTPTLAKEWTRCISPKQRSLRESHVQYLLRLVENDEWDPECPERIVFDEAGLIIDGQHRVHAIARGTKAVWVEVTYNRPTRVGAHMNNGLRRTLGPQLFLEDVIAKEGCEKAGSIARQLVMIENPSVKQPTMGEAAAVMRKYKANFTRVHSLCYGRGPLGRSTVQAALTIAHSRYSAETESFVLKAKGDKAKDAGDITDKWLHHLNASPVAEADQSHSVFYAIKYDMLRRRGRPEWSEAPKAKEFFAL